MDFGKLPSVDNVDFTFPPDPANNWRVLARCASTAAPALYLGATGYNMKPWVGHWYPAGTRDKDFLSCYGTLFNTIEHNTTHYRIPDAATVARWREETPADFRFCPKIPQTISHARDLGVSGNQIELFVEAIAGLEEKLGCCFLQLPPYFDTRHLLFLTRFLDRFPATVPLAVEVRHPSFFESTASAENYFQLLEDQNIATVVTDVAGRRDVCHMRLSNARVLVRFVGNDLHSSDYTRIQAWAQRIKQWTDQGLQEVYFFTHEPDNLKAPELAAYCCAQFQEAIPNARLRGPKPWVDPAGVQGSLF